MTGRTTEGRHTYDDVGELLSELELTDEGMAHARDVTDDHVRAWHLVRVRAEQDRTQEEVAHVMGVRQPRISAIERGELDVVTLATLRTCALSAGAFGSWRTSATESTD